MATFKPSDEQAAIFSWFSGTASEQSNLVVRARAGTGKTTTIIEGLSRAPEVQSGDRVLLAAFSTLIAKQAGEKLRQRGLNNVECKTLHSAGYAAILQQWRGVRPTVERGYALASKAAGGSAPDEMVRLIQKLAGMGKNCLPLAWEDERAMFALAQQFDCEPDPSWEDDGWSTRRVVSCAIEAMRLSLNRNEGAGMVDFDDQLFVPVVNKFARPTYRLVIIDEAQDMNATQIHLCLRLCDRRNGGRVVVVGDDRQAIFGFRGASTDSIDRLKVALQAKELGLTMTYRCGKAIVARAARLVPDYRAPATAHEGEVTDKSMEEMFEQAQPGDAILSRLNAPLVGVCLRFLKKGMRARIEGRKYGQTIMALVRDLKARTWDSFMVKLEQWKKREIAKVDARAKAKGQKADTTAEDAKRDEICDLYDVLVALGSDLKSVDKLLDRIQILFDDTKDGELPMIVCSSIHRSKGLEWDRVYLLTSTLYRGGRKQRSAEAGRERDQEEANLEYVAMTRPKHALFLVSKG